MTEDMTKPYTGGPAFPNVAQNMQEGEKFRWDNGMTLRDYFAGQALAAIQLHYMSSPSEAHGAATTAYQVADAMLAARDEETKP